MLIKIAYNFFTFLHINFVEGKNDGKKNEIEIIIFEYNNFGLHFMKKRHKKNMQR